MDLLKAEFQKVIALVEEQQSASVMKLTAEEKRVKEKFDHVYNVLTRKKSEIQGEREQIKLALTEDDDNMFFKVNYNSADKVKRNYPLFSPFK